MSALLNSQVKQETRLTDQLMLLQTSVAGKEKDKHLFMRRATQAMPLTEPSSTNSDYFKKDKYQVRCVTEGY